MTLVCVAFLTNSSAVITPSCVQVHLEVHVIYFFPPLSHSSISHLSSLQFSRSLPPISFFFYMCMILKNREKIRMDE